MRVLKLTIAALLTFALATPVAAQVASPNARTLNNEPTVENALCGARPRTPRGTVLTQIIVRGADGIESCTWSTESYTDPQVLRQQRAERAAAERARIDAELRTCALAYARQYNMYYASAALMCLGAGARPLVGYSNQYYYGQVYPAPYRDPSNPFR